MRPPKFRVSLPAARVKRILVVNRIERGLENSWESEKRAFCNATLSPTPLAPLSGRERIWRRTPKNLLEEIEFLSFRSLIQFAVEYGVDDIDTVVTSHENASLRNG